MRELREIHCHLHFHIKHKIMTPKSSSGQKVPENTKTQMLTSISRYFMTLLLRFSNNRSKKTRWTSKQTFWFESRGLSMRERNIQSSFLYLWSNPPSLFDRRLNCQFWRILSNNNYLLGLGLFRKFQIHGRCAYKLPILEWLEQNK